MHTAATAGNLQALDYGNLDRQFHNTPASHSSTCKDPGYNRFKTMTWTSCATTTTTCQCHNSHNHKTCCTAHVAIRGHRSLHLQLVTRTAVRQFQRLAGLVLRLQFRTNPASETSCQDLTLNNEAAKTRFLTSVRSKDSGLRVCTA